MKRDAYQILGLLPTAEPEVVKAAVRALTLKYHPDKPAGDAETFEIVRLAACALRDGVRWVDVPDSSPGLAKALRSIWGPLRRR